MQVTDGTLKALQDNHGELKDHMLYIPKDKILDPSINICAGIRWLFQKKHLADHHLHRDANWLEVIAHYKGFLDLYLAKEDGERSKKIIHELQKLYEGMQE